LNRIVVEDSRLAADSDASARGMSSFDDRIDACRGRVAAVRTTVVLDDDLLAEARRLTGVQEKTALIRAGLTALIERESARRLARLGGSEPDLRPIARRRPDAG
jgi:Arc/MetJ family transcription regulator